MLVSNNFSNLNSNKALSYKKNMNSEISKSNSNDSFQKNSKTKNPSFGVGEIYNAVGPWGLVAAAAAIAITLGYFEKHGKSLDEIQHREIGDARRKANLTKNELKELKTRAINIKKIHNAGTVVSKAVKKTAKEVTKLSVV